MRLCTFSLLFAIACGPKADPAPAVAEAPAPAADPAPQPEPEPEPEPEPAAAEPNIDLQVTIAYGDGSSVSGRAIRVERSEDFYAQKGWTDREMKLTIPLEEGDTEVEVTWSDVRTVDIRLGGSEDIDCTYDSTYDPMLYICELGTTTTVTTTDGKKRAATSRYKWKFTFDDGTSEELWIRKVALLKQESADLKAVDLQIAMRDELLAARKGRTPVRVTIATP